VSRTFVEIAGRRLSLSNLEKDLYPSCGFTKARVLEYYGRISPFILPHLHGRALTLMRYPDGVQQPFFFEKRCPSHRPDWVRTAEVPGDAGARITACLVDDLATLVWVANLASLELHVPLARAATPGTPDAVVFDLDPGEPADILDCARVALILRDLLGLLGLSSCPKTSGRKGLHVYVPLNRGEATFAATRTFSRAVAVTLQKNYPDLVTVRMGKKVRKGRVFINWSQNDAARTMICAYSLRAREKPLVSAPLSWRELENLAGEGSPGKFRIGPAEAVERAETMGDLFREMLVKEQKLPHL
jgi:bifunctional non-homologous end joining protein LigD